MKEQKAIELARRIANDIQTFKYVESKCNPSIPVEKWQRVEAEYIEYLASIIKNY
jgi:hypothetical protein